MSSGISTRRTCSWDGEAYLEATHAEERGVLLARQVGAVHVVEGRVAPLGAHGSGGVLEGASRSPATQPHLVWV